MPYRKYGKRKRSYGSKYKSKRRATGLDKRIARIAKRTVYRNRESKWVCVSPASDALTESWQILDSSTAINGLVQGDSSGQRDGDVVMSRGIQLKVQLAAAIDRPQSVRLFVIEKKDDFVIATDLPGTTVRPMIGCVTPAMKVKYRVLMDKVITITPAVDDSGTSLFRNVYKNFFFKVNKRLHFTGPSYGDFDVGKIYVCAVTDNLAGGTDHIDVTFEATHYFKDI